VLDATAAAVAGYGELREREVPMLNALNEVLRDDFIRDSEAGIGRWNRVIEKAGLPYRLSLPHKAFNRRIGSLAGIHVSPDGSIVATDRWSSRLGDWIPTDEDRAFVASLMKRVVEPGQYAGWIAPPRVPVDDRPMDFEYVRFN
jgi:benzoyl-CoA 2,3-dioxygenase component B